MAGETALPIVRFSTGHLFGSRSTKRQSGCTSRSRWPDGKQLGNRWQLVRYFSTFNLLHFCQVSKIHHENRYKYKWDENTQIIPNIPPSSIYTWVCLMVFLFSPDGKSIIWWIHSFCWCFCLGRPFKQIQIYIYICIPIVSQNGGSCTCCMVLTL